MPPPEEISTRNDLVTKLVLTDNEGNWYIEKSEKTAPGAYTSPAQADQISNYLLGDELLQWEFKWVPEHENKNGVERWHSDILQCDVGSLV